jgi:Zn-dependent M28 family amino/carboxypeptidase
MRKATVPALAALALACSSGPNLQPAMESITAGELLQHTKVLASDLFEGRSPGTRGEDRTVEYLVGHFRAMGLRPGNPDGTYVQNVPLTGITSKVQATLAAGGRKLALEPRTEFVALSRRFAPEVKVADSQLVFVGYGVAAPEYEWDDYKGVDVKGKTLVMLVNDPAVPDPNDASKLDESYFKGRAMTYYGRWTYKYEIASEKGAAAAIVVHETGPAGYPFAVVGDSWGRENFEIQREDRNMGRVPVEAWIAEGKARELLKLAGQDFDALKRAALRKDFKPVTLNARANFTVRSDLREVQSRNVIAKLEGAEKPAEYVTYTAHWDHLGRDETLHGDQIFNGAVDNATGTAGLLEIAQAFTRLNPKPRRSILFLAVTAEEKGLLGAKYYAENPLYPLKNTVAVINMDGLNQWGRTRDIVLVGYGNSDLDEITTIVAKTQERVIKPDAEPEKGYFYRSDHFEFAKLGVPGLYPDSGTEYLDKPEGYGMQKREEYTAKDYHKVSDEVKPDWDLSGAVEDLQLLFEVGYRVAQGEKYPEWKPGTEFKAKREASLKE